MCYFIWEKRGLPRWLSGKESAREAAGATKIQDLGMREVPGLSRWTQSNHTRF